MQYRHCRKFISNLCKHILCVSTNYSPVSLGVTKYYSSYVLACEFTSSVTKCKKKKKSTRFVTFIFTSFLHLFHFKLLKYEEKSTFH